MENVEALEATGSSCRPDGRNENEKEQKLNKTEVERRVIDSKQKFVTPESTGLTSNVGSIPMMTPFSDSITHGDGGYAQKTMCSSMQVNSVETTGLTLPVWHLIQSNTLNSSCRLDNSLAASAEYLEGNKGRKTPSTGYGSPVMALRNLHQGTEQIIPRGEVNEAQMMMMAGARKTSSSTETAEDNELNQRRCKLWRHQYDELPITPVEALEQCGGHLSTYEQKEILSFQYIYYCGRHAFDTSSGSSNTDELKQPQSQIQIQTHSPNFDDSEGNYCTVPGDHIGYRFEVIDVIGQGTYGIVLRALDYAARPAPKQCALKIAKSSPSYAKALETEAGMLDFLWREKPLVRMWIPQVLARLRFRSHEVLAIPLLGIDIKDLLRLNLFRSLPMALTCSITAQVVFVLKALAEANITHADLNPNNITLVDRDVQDVELPSSIENQISLEEQERRSTYSDKDQKGKKSLMQTSEQIEGKKNNYNDNDVVTSHVAIIDFGAAHVGTPCMYPVQVTLYRSPEVALCLPYGPAIDMWSLGCVVYELVMGVPLFPVDSETEPLQHHITVLGMPSSERIRRLENLRTSLMSVPGDEKKGTGNLQELFASLQTETKRYATRSSVREKNLLQLLHIQEKEEKNHRTVHFANDQQSAVKAHPSKFAVSEKENGEEKTQVLLLLDFLLGCLMWNPEERLTPVEASCHPFLASCFKTEGKQKGEKTLLIRTHCTGMYYLRTHDLTCNATNILEAAERVCTNWDIDVNVLENEIQVLPHLDTCIAIQPLSRFSSHSSGSDDFETPLWVSTRARRPTQTTLLTGGNDDEEECPTSYMTAFFDPIEQVHVSIMSFDGY